MEVLNSPVDYSLETLLLNDDEDCKLPEIVSAQKLEIESPEVRCMKGDCNQDYAPG